MARRNRADKAARFLDPGRGPKIRDPRLYYRWKVLEFTASRLRKLARGVELRRHTHLSRDIYEEYGDWEMRIYEAGQVFTYDHGRMGHVPLKAVRDAYLAPVEAEIRALAEARGGPVRVLEVGCGNGTNLMLLNERLGDRASLAGIDIAARRIELGRGYWGARLDGVELGVDSALTLAGQADDSADLVFSVHCLEQLPYHVAQAVAAMARVARRRIVFVEPLWEIANTAQRLYAMLGDQLRTLLPEIEAAGLTVLRTEAPEVLANPLNRTGVVVVDPRPCG